MPEGSFFRLPVQIVAGLIGFVMVVLVAVVLIARLGSKANDAGRDRTTEQGICTSTIDTIQGLPGGIDATSRQNMAEPMGRLVDISAQLADKHPEYQRVTAALSAVRDDFATGRSPSSMASLIHECVLIGMSPR